MMINNISIIPKVLYVINTFSAICQTKMIFCVLILLLAIIVHLPVIRFHQDYRTSIWFMCIRSVVWVHFYLLKNINASSHIS